MPSLSSTLTTLWQGARLGPPTQPSLSNPHQTVRHLKALECRIAGETVTQSSSTQSPKGSRAGEQRHNHAHTCTACSALTKLLTPQNIRTPSGGQVHYLTRGQLGLDSAPEENTQVSMLPLQTRIMNHSCLLQGKLNHPA